MSIVVDKKCPFCEETISEDEIYCSNCDHYLREEIIDKQDPLKYKKTSYRRTFLFGLISLAPLFFGVFALSMFSYIAYSESLFDRLHLLMGFVFLIVSTLIGIVVGHFNEVDKSTIYKAIIIAFIYAAYMSVVVGVYINEDAYEPWEYALPIAGLIGTSGYLILVTWIVKIIKQKKMSKRREYKDNT